MIPLKVKLILAAIVVVGAFIAGWQVKSAFVAKRDLAIMEAKKEFIDAYKQAEGNRALAFENKLQELRANERIIERERLKIIDRPVYNNECLDDDGLQLIERARTGSTNTSKSTN